MSAELWVLLSTALYVAVCVLLILRAKRRRK